MQEVAFAGLGKIYKKNLKYKKAGVYVNELFDELYFQYTLWDDMAKITKRNTIAKTADFINSSIGKIYVAIQKPKTGKHHTNQSRKSPNYTTNIDEVPVIDIDKKFN